MTLFIPVVHVNRVRGKEYFIYVGRPFAGLEGHELGNPFGVKQYPHDALDRYHDWLEKLPNRNRLLECVMHDTEAGRFPIACWCGDWLHPNDRPPACHAVIISEWVTKVFGKNWGNR
jgi:hypothetical protein